MLSASAAAGVSPVLLEHPVVAAEGLVEFRAVAGSLSDAEIEIALISVFLAAAVEPCVQIRVGDGFFNFMRQRIGHAICAAISVGTGGLDFAAGGALIHVTHECPFDVLAIEGLSGMEPAELGAEAPFFNVRGC